MRIADKTLASLLLGAGKVDPNKLTELQEEANKAHEPLQEIVYQKKLLSERDLTKLYADSMKVKFIDLGNKKLDAKIIGKIPERVAQKYQVVLYEAGKNSYKLAMADPGDLQAIDFLQKLLGKNIQIYMATQSDVARALDTYKGSLDTEITKVIPEGQERQEEEVSAEEVSEDSPVAKTVNLIIEYAIKKEASDIHIEPRESNVVVRYRVDGILREANTLPRSIMAALVSRIKIMANLKIDEHRAPQDGRFKISGPVGTIALRVSTLPVMDGEKVVMRLLDESSQALTLDELGFNKSALQRMEKAMTQPNGIILVTGPTGSGKSTTLYSVLSILNTPKVNISTVEDPVEYRIPGVNQTQVNPKAGMTFANGLRALLRQDPNVIMVGEIRDGETAELAIQAALTGHLVLSTLHTNDSATALPRLLDMGVEPFLIASTVRAIVGQRLVRKIAKDQEKYTSSESETENIKTGLGELLPTGEADAKKLQERLGFKTIPTKSDDKFELVRGKDTETTPGGYKGRMGIYEVLEVDDAIGQLIMNNATSEELSKKAVEQGMVTMMQDGYLKALNGQTTTEEIVRVTHE